MRAAAEHERRGPLGGWKAAGSAGGLSRILWSISLPVIFAEVSETVIHVTDTAFLARVGVAELGAIAIADMIWELFLVLPLGLVDGVQILTARHAGRGRPQRVGETFNQGLALIVAVSVGLAVALAAGGPLLCGLLVQSPAVSVAVQDFLRLACYGIPFAAVSFAYSALLVSLGMTRVLVPATLVLALTNGALSYILVFGKLGLPAMGIRGAALGSVGAEVSTFLFLTIYLLRRVETRRFALFRFGRWDRKAARALVRISAPVSLQALAEAVRWSGFFIIMERLGQNTLAAANVVYACYAVFRIPTEGFAETACSMVSRLIGRDQADRIGPLMRNVIQAAGLASLPFIALGLLVPDWILSIFTSDPVLLDASTGSLRIVALAMLVIIPAEMWFTAVTGTGDTLAALTIEVVMTLMTLGSTYVAAFAWSGSLEVVWGSLSVAWLVCLLVSYGWIKSGLWRRLGI